MSRRERNGGRGARVLVLSAGSAMGSNLVRSLRAGDPSLFIAGCDDSRFHLRKSEADRRYLLPIGESASPDALRGIVRQDRIDLVIPTSDADVLQLSKARYEVGCRTFLPRAETVAFCNDKYRTTSLLRRRGIPAPLTYPITSLDRVASVFRRFGRRNRLWCRVRGGAGSYAAIPVRSPEQVRSWIRYWQRMRFVPPGSFTLSEYLPGRDLCVQCLWDKGTLVLAKMAERLTYFDMGGPSGVSSMPTLAKTVFDARVLRYCRRAIRAVDRRASGVFFIDIKENENGDPCITEINAGRFATMTNIHDLAGRHNMAVAYVRLALGEKLRVAGASDYARGYYLVRSVDTTPALFHEDELSEGIQRAPHAHDAPRASAAAAGRRT